MNIVAIAGSPRLNGNTNYLVDQALEEAKKTGAKTEKIILNKHRIKPCLGHVNCASLKKCSRKDDAAEILDKFRQADGVILGTPVYYYNVTAQMKAFIDRNYFLYKHETPYNARAAGIIVVAEESGIEDTIKTLAFLLKEMKVPEDRRFVVSGYASKPGEVQADLPLVEAARRLGQKLVESLK
jgi:multimeric flavodoxin WrbA